jgi:hypothetical protein
VPKRVAIVQSNYIPWKGYFDLIRLVDEFILFDDVQYTRRDWRNRNLIKSSEGLLWLSVPVSSKGRFLQAIKDTEVQESDWARRHWQTLVRSYARAPHFDAYRSVFEDAYARAGGERRLSDINRIFVDVVCGLLGLETRITWSMDYTVRDGKTERLVELCRQANATEYVSGPAARVYLDESQFRDAGITLRFIEYGPYPDYPQLYPPFAHNVSVLDLLFHLGDAARGHLVSTLAP